MALTLAWQLGFWLGAARAAAVCAHAFSLNPDACVLAVLADRSLVDVVDSSASQRQERLESELHGHKTNLIKESIRQSHNLLGDFYYNRGDLQVGTTSMCIFWAGEGRNYHSVLC